MTGWGAWSTPGMTANSATTLGTLGKIDDYASSNNAPGGYNSSIGAYNININHDGVFTPGQTYDISVTFDDVGFTAGDTISYDSSTSSGQQLTANQVDISHAGWETVELDNIGVGAGATNLIVSVVSSNPINFNMTDVAVVNTLDASELSSDHVGAAPEPSTWLMMILGAIGLGLVGRRHSSQGGTKVLLAS